MVFSLIHISVNILVQSWTNFQNWPNTMQKKICTPYHNVATTMLNCFEGIVFLIDGSPYIAFSFRSPSAKLRDSSLHNICFEKSIVFSMFSLVNPILDLKLFWETNSFRCAMNPRKEEPSLSRQLIVKVLKFVKMFKCVINFPVEQSIIWKILFTVFQEPLKLSITFFSPSKQLGTFLINNSCIHFCWYHSKHAYQ